MKKKSTHGYQIYQTAIETGKNMLKMHIRLIPIKIESISIIVWITAVLWESKKVYEGICTFNSKYDVQHSD